MKIFPKLLLATLLPTLVVVVLSSALTYANLQRGFVTYVSALESRRLEPVVERLAEIHATEGSFASVTADPGLWREVLRTGSPRPPPPPQRPPRQRPDPPGRHSRGPGPPGGHPAPDPFELTTRIALYDAAGRPLIGPGPLASEGVLKPIVVDGVQVGTLGIATVRHIGAELDIAYIAGQRQSLIGVTLLALILASLVALLVSRRLASSVGELADGARELAAGRYSTRLESESRDELGALARDFNALALALDEAQRARQRWIADTSHELRTPLTVLQGELEAMQDGIRPLNLEQVGVLHTELSLLNRLVDDLALLARADRGGLSYSMATVELGELARSVAEQHRPGLEADGFELKLELEPALITRADALRLRQLIGNLLENSRRYTDAPGAVRVRVWTADRRVHLLVEDGPPGAPADALPRLFERFFRPDEARSRVHGGSGLGLAICAQIAKAHQGALRATPSELGGLAIHLELPVEGG